MFCSWEIYVWISASPWTIPFLSLEDSPFNYYALFAVSAVGMALNIVILYYLGRTIGWVLTRIIDADLAETGEPTKPD
jgi:hypothetical protein